MKPTPKAEEEIGQIPLGDYGLYQCSVCGKMVMGFDREAHDREAHLGKSPEYRKIR